MKDFENRIALVTGGARGIGGGIAASLAGAGAKVIVTDILDEVGEALASLINEEGGSATYHHLDVTREQEWSRLAGMIEDRFGRLDILVNAAGILIPGRIADASYADYKRVMDISCDGTFLGMKYGAPLLARRPDAAEYGAIINISSITAFTATPSALSYGASRAAVLSMTKSAARDFAESGLRIRVNSVHPGSVKTELSNITYGRLMSQGMTLEEAQASMTRLHPLGRLGTPEDIAEAVLFLASDKASWITGTSLTVDGGRLA